jgi:hypothetical protein
VWSLKESLQAMVASERLVFGPSRRMEERLNE